VHKLRLQRHCVSNGRGSSSSLLDATTTHWRWTSPTC